KAGEAAETPPAATVLRKRLREVIERSYLNRARRNSPIVYFLFGLEGSVGHAETRLRSSRAVPPGGRGGSDPEGRKYSRFGNLQLSRAGARRQAGHARRSGLLQRAGHSRNLV